MLEIFNWNALTGEQQSRLLERPAQRVADDVETTARRIVEDVRTGGDAAVQDWTRQLDGVAIAASKVPVSDIDAALAQCDSGLRTALEQARDNVTRFHEQQLRPDIALETVPGVVCERLYKPLAVVGLYVPAGTAPLPSSVIMMAVPAGLAGCSRKILCTPPRQDGTVAQSILSASALCGVTDVYRVGGAQAIAAMAFGTESVPRVDKIFGPGNAYVAAAKTVVSRLPGGALCDMTAGPSEVLVIADREARPDFVASDLLAQAEHGSDSQVLLITDDRDLAVEVQLHANDLLTRLPRAEIARKALSNSPIIIIESFDQAFEIANRYAPEHLILQLADARQWLARVVNAGSVFLGHWTPEALGDYCSGTNHVLPTNGFARVSSGLGVADFQKTVTVQEATASGLGDLGPTAVALASVEQLDAHALSVTLRLEHLERGAQ